MANEMIKFYKGAVGSLPTSGVNGALYITTDEGGIYLGTGTGMKRLGDFIQVNAVADLPAKAHEGCLYYCVAENILAKWNGTEWKQINKQPTAEEMKTLLGLGSMAYKSEVAEADLNAALAEKINTVAEGNHAHANKGVLDGITAEKVAAWDASEGNAKTYADGLNTAMNTRVEALEAIDHEHANKALLDTYTQTEANLADAVAKKHEHANAAELAKIADGDKAKWDAVAADHLTSADKTTLENAIKEAKKAGTDANTALESYKVTNDAAIDAIEEDIAEIVDGTNGILAQAKSYSDGKLATARTEISAEIDADVKVVADELAGYKTSNDAALAGVKATADAAATKAYTDAELAKKVDKDTYAADKATFAVAETVNAELAKKANAADVVANDTFESFKTANTQDIADAKKAGTDAAAAAKAAQDTADAKTTMAEVEAKGYQNAEQVQAIADGKDAAIQAAQDKADSAYTLAEGKATMAQVNEAIAGAGHAVKKDVDQAIADMDAAYKKADSDMKADLEGKINAKVAQSDYDAKVAELAGADTTLQGNIDALADKVGTPTEGKTIVQMIEDAQTAATYDDTQVKADIKDNADAIDAIEADYLKKADKEELQGNIDTLTGVVETLRDGIDADKVDGIKDLIKYVEDHGPEVTGMKEDIADNAKAISDHEALAAETYETKTDAAQKLVDAKAYTDTEVGKDRERLVALEGKVDVEKVSTAISTAVAGEKTRAEAKETELAAAIEAAKVDAANKDAVVLAEAQQASTAVQTALDTYKTENNAEVAKKANAADVYTKTETYTQAEVDALIAAAHTWGSF